MNDALASIPRVDLGFLPTPLQRLDRLSDALGGPRVYIKRDDCTGLATGGNKTRKLEYLLADAKRSGADTVVTYGAVQSNHARQTAAACAKLGLGCHLILTRRVTWSHPEYETSGNVLLDRLLGAKLHIVDVADADATSRRVTDELARAGKRCYVVPTGGSNAIGALGYVRCAAEIVEQCAALGFGPDAIVHATSSGGTQAGLVAGLIAQRVACDVIGVNVYDTDHARLERRVARLLDETLQRIGATSDARPLHFAHDHLGADYGIPTPQTVDAIRTLASLEGVLTDPVYSGKGLGGLFAMIRAGALANCRNVVFVHTGGTASLPVYTGAFA